MYAISDLYIINILHSISQARIVKVYSFDSTCYTYYESVRWRPPNLYHLIHCMCSIDHIIRYSVAYLCANIFQGGRNRQLTPVLGHGGKKSCLIV
ncbi:hypothetical protein L208DRAFT_1250874 [Tricholoma matsutake]|nr:hypothetical protein L208DRAFT_1250874 [Tricholoma matsutake 945]